MPAEGPPRQHILIVEDDLATRDALGFILKGEGYRVSTAATGPEALDRLRGASAPDLILLDLLLPGMSGAELRQHLEEDPRLAGVPVVVVSAATDLRQKAASLHATDYLDKSADLGTLLDTIRRHCGQPQKSA